MNGRVEGGEELDRLVGMPHRRRPVTAPAGEVGEQEMGGAHLESGLHGDEAGEGVGEALDGAVEVTGGERDAPERPPGRGLHQAGPHPLAGLEGIAQVAAGLLETAGREVGLAEPDLQHPRVPGVGEGGLLLDGAPDALDGAVDVPLLAIGEPQDAEGERPAERVGRPFEAARAVADAGLPLTAGGAEPAGQEVGVALQAPVAQRIADLPGPDELIERELEVAGLEQVDAPPGVGLREPPALAGPVEPPDRLPAVLGTGCQLPRPEPLPAEHVVRPADGARVGGALGRRERLPRVPHRVEVPLSQVAVGVGEPEVVRTREGRLVEALHLVQVLGEQLEAVGEAPHEVEGARERRHELGAAPGARLRGKPLDLGERPPQRLGGLDMGVAARRLLREAAQRLDGLLGLLGPVPMVGELIGDLLETSAVERLQGAGGGRVKGPAPGGEEALVGDLLDERMVEGVAGLVQRRRGLEELQALQLGDVRVEAGSVPDQQQQPGRELAAQHGADLEHASSFVVQPVDAGHEHALHRLRHDRVLRSVALVDGSGELLEEEGVALAPPDDGLRPIRDRRREQRAHELAAVVRRKPGQGELRHVGASRPGRLVAGPIRAEQQDRLPAEVVHEARQELLGRPVHPVEVLDHEHEGAPPRAGHAHLDERLERADLDGLGRDVRPAPPSPPSRPAGGAAAGRARADPDPPPRGRPAPSSPTPRARPPRRCRSSREPGP